VRTAGSFIWQIRRPGVIPRRKHESSPPGVECRPPKIPVGRRRESDGELAQVATRPRDWSPKPVESVPCGAAATGLSILTGGQPAGDGRVTPHPAQRERVSPRGRAEFPFRPPRHGKRVDARTRL